MEKLLKEDEKIFNLLERIKESKNLVFLMVGLIFRLCICFLLNYNS